MGRFGKFLWLAIGNFSKLLGDSFFGFMTNRTGVCSMKNSYKKDRDCYKKIWTTVQPVLNLGLCHYRCCVMLPAFNEMQ